MEFKNWNSKLINSSSLKDRKNRDLLKKKSGGNLIEVAERGREKGFETERGEGDRDGGSGGRVQDVKMGVRLGATCRPFIGLVSYQKVNVCDWTYQITTRNTLWWTSCVELLFEFSNRFSFVWAAVRSILIFLQAPNQLSYF